MGFDDPPSSRSLGFLGVAIGLSALAVGIYCAASVMSSSWERVRSKPADRIIDVTGSAKRRITSDYAEWSAVVATDGTDRAAAYRDLAKQVADTIAFLKEKGVGDAEVRVGAVAVDEVTRDEVVGTGDSRVQRTLHVAWRTSQRVTVSSANVALVEQMSREVTALLEKGITITSNPPAYFYTKLGDLKIEMLAAASADARTRAENIIKSAGGAALGKLRDADMGVINVNPANSTDTSWEGNNDTSSVEKDIITIIHTKYELQ